MRRRNAIIGLLVACLSLSIMPVEAFAEDIDAETQQEVSQPMQEENEESEEEIDESVTKDAEEDKKQTSDIQSTESKDKTEEKEASEEEEIEDVDPGSARLQGDIPEEFFGPMTMSRAVSYKHDSRFSNYTIQKGVDVSKWQKNIDWKKAKADGVQFAFIRVAYRTTGKGELKTDEYAIKNLQGAAAAGIPVGVYIFSQATTTNEAVAEANYIVSKIKGYKITLPVVFDFEYYPGGRLEKKNLSRRAQTDICKAFCNKVKAYGYTPMVYANYSMLTHDLYASELSAQYQIWLARYASAANYSGAYNYWQYTSSGTVKGMDGKIDMNYRYIPKTTPATVVSGTTVSGQASAFDTIKLTWNKVATASGYEIQRYSSSKKAYTTIATVTNGSTVSYTNGNLNSSTTYKYRVRAYRNVGSTKAYSPYSSVISVKTKGSVKGKVTASVNIRSGAGTSYKTLKKVKKNTSLTITGSNGSWYRVSVTVGGKKKTGYLMKKRVKLTSSSASSSTSKPGKPTLSAKASRFDKIKLSWKKVSGASGYQIQRYSASKKKYVTIKTITKGSTVSYTNGSLNANTTYKYRVRAYKKVGSKKVYGSYSSVKSAKTKGSKTGKITAKDVNVRKGAGTSYASLKKLKKGTKLKVTGSKGSWYRVSLTIGGKKKTAYVFKKYIKL